MTASRRFGARLSLRFSPALLRRDLALCLKDFRVYANAVNEGTMYVAPLLSPGGDPRALGHCAGRKDFAPTPLLARCDYFREVLDSLPCPKLSARLIRMPAGHGLVPHRDNWRGFRFGVLRLHVPILTNPGVKFLIGSESFRWRAGELWYGEFSAEHSVKNAGKLPRTHLVVDVLITPGLLKLFPKPFLRPALRHGITKAPAPFPLPRKDLEKFVGEFELPRGLIPSAKLSSRPLNRASISLAQNGALLLRSNEIGTLTLLPLSRKSVYPRGIGAGSVLTYQRSGKTKRIKVLAKGILRAHPFSGEVMMQDLEHVATLSAP